MKKTIKSFITNLTFSVLRNLAGDGFANEQFPAKLLIKYFFIQKIMRINAHVPWPVHPTSRITHVKRIDRGTRCPGLSPGCYIQGKNGIVFGVNVWVGPGVGIISANHNKDNYHEHIKSRPIRIGDHCWIGMNAIILPGVELGDHVIVGAGSVVSHSFERNCVIAGNPAKIIKKIGPYEDAQE